MSVQVRSVRRLTDLAYELVFEDEHGTPSKPFVYDVVEGDIPLVQSPDDAFAYFGYSATPPCAIVWAFYLANKKLTTE